MYCTLTTGAGACAPTRAGAIMQPAMTRRLAAVSTTMRLVIQSSGFSVFRSSAGFAGAIDLGEARRGPSRPPSKLSDVFVVGFRGHVGQRLPAADLLAQCPGHRLHPDHDAVIILVELLPEVVTQPDRKSVV